MKEVTEIGKLAWLTKSRILLLVVSVVVVSSLTWYFVEIHLRKPTPNGTTTITGEYLMVANPCTTDPCLPGIVYAVLVDNTYYYLTVGDSFIWSTDYRSWEGYTPNKGDYVQVTGYVSRDIDVFGNPFYVLEVLSLKPAE